ncbi:hypothetical protein J8V57_00240 [Xenorhabdus sp. PB61.4]|uniref:DUF7823 domain-containing protein n=1 Tax=Xenorhabdus sp. PB61.4 TaxID=2788940 RepID=UPI001E3086EA|nr:hypothetical protein [Xenorhabdus sp. PB61.4]MCC8364724.1 hypothetical protein [Xenorhabdus sp. PB61.4]
MSEINKPVIAFPNYDLVLDITMAFGDYREVYGVPGGSSVVGYSSVWGYNHDQIHMTTILNTGSLSVIKSYAEKIINITTVDWVEHVNNYAPSGFRLRGFSYDNSLFEKDLEITVDGVLYFIGKCISAEWSKEFGFNCLFENNSDAQKLSYVLKQTGVTKRLQFLWDS